MDAHLRDRVRISVTNYSSRCQKFAEGMQSRPLG
jgi:hypothetical protein